VKKWICSHCDSINPMGSFKCHNCPNSCGDEDINKLQKAKEALHSPPEPGPIRSIAFECTAEVMMAKEKWPTFNSAHEGFAVLKEEVDELWDHVKTNQKRRDIEAMRKECIQVAAMAMRFALEICNEQAGRK